MTTTGMTTPQSAAAAAPATATLRLGAWLDMAAKLTRFVPAASTGDTWLRALRFIEHDGGLAGYATDKYRVAVLVPEGIAEEISPGFTAVVPVGLAHQAAQAAKAAGRQALLGQLTITATEKAGDCLVMLCARDLGGQEVFSLNGEYRHGARPFPDLPALTSRLLANFEPGIQDVNPIAIDPAFLASFKGITERGCPIMIHVPAHRHKPLMVTDGAAVQFCCFVVPFRVSSEKVGHIGPAWQSLLGWRQSGDSAA